MNSIAMSSTADGDDGAVRLRYIIAPYMAVWAMLVLIALACIGALSLGYRPSDFDLILTFVSLNCLVFPVLAMHRERNVFDRTAVLVLDPNGLLDRRISPKPIPWSQVKRARPIQRYETKTPPYGVKVEFKEETKLQSKEDVPNSSLLGPISAAAVYIDLREVRIRPAEFVEHIRRLAPHVAVMPSSRDL
jgi:hypothetical protein